LKCLINSDINHDGWLSVEEVYNDLHPEVVDYSEQYYPTVQHPQLSDGYEGELLFVEI